MLSRWYLIFLGPVLIVMAIAGYRADQFLGAANLTFWTPTIWLVTGILALGIGLLLKSVMGLRWTAGVLGLLYLIWGVVALFTPPTEPVINLMSLVSMFMVIFGSLGLAAALAPAYWLREHETYAPGRA